MSDDSQPAGRVVILNGASSVGKTTLADAFCSERASQGECWLVVGIDDFLAKLPAAWFAGDDHRGALSEDGIRFIQTGDGLLPVAGPLGRQLLAAYRRTVAACARAGFDVVVDEVAFDEFAVKDWNDALAGLQTIWVAVRCDLDVVTARERERGDRVPGLARGLTAVVHERAVYDFEIDTTSESIDELVSMLSRFVLAA